MGVAGAGAFIVRGAAPSAGGCQLVGTFGAGSPAARAEPPAVTSIAQSTPSTLKMHCLRIPAFSCLLLNAFIAPEFEKATVSVRPSKPASEVCGSTVIQRNFFSVFRTSMISGHARRNISTDPVAPDAAGRCWDGAAGGADCAGAGAWWLVGAPGWVVDPGPDCAGEEGPACAAAGAAGWPGARCCAGAGVCACWPGAVCSAGTSGPGVAGFAGSGSGTAPQVPPQSREAGGSSACGAAGAAEVAGACAG